MSLIRDSELIRFIIVSLNLQATSGDKADGLVEKDQK
jgi:hypothetical protein